MIIKHVFTPKGLEKIKSEKEIIMKKRKEAVVNLRTAREMGDLSENAAYHVAKQKLSSIDSRIRHLNHLIRSAKIISIPNTHVIGIGSQVELFDGKKHLIFEIVGSFEANPHEGKISYLSPLGKALMGVSLHSKVGITTPNGVTTYQVVRIKNIPMTPISAL